MPELKKIAFLMLAATLIGVGLWLTSARKTGAPIELEPARDEEAFLEGYSGTSQWLFSEPGPPGSWRALRKEGDAQSPEVVLASKPQRIVSQSLASDEILLELVATERITAITHMASDPRYSNVAQLATELDLARVTNSSEQILGLRPDVVFVTSFSTLETVHQLRKAGAPVIQLGGYESLAGIADNLRVIGFATGEEKRAEEMIGMMLRRIDAAVRSLPQDRPKWRVLSYTDGTVWAARTTFDEVMTLLGAINIPSEAGLSGWPRVSLEQILAWQPEVLVAGALEGEEERARQDLLSLPGIADTPAGKAGRILVIPSRLFSTVSQHIAGFVEVAARGLGALEPVSLDSGSLDSGSPDLGAIDLGSESPAPEIFEPGSAALRESP